MAVNVTYSSTGQIASIQRGTTSEKVDYDGQGRIVSRVFADGKTWSYTYLEKVCLCSSVQMGKGWLAFSNNHTEQGEKKEKQQHMTEFYLLF